MKMANKIEHIYCFVAAGLDSPSTRYRAYYPLTYIKSNHRISYDFVYPSLKTKNILHFIRVYLSILFFRKKNSLVVIQKVCSNRVYGNLLKLLILIHNKKTIYDIDDAEYFRTKVNSLHFFLKRCQLVSVGSHKLLEYCKNYNKNVYLQTSPVLIQNNRKLNKNKLFTIGWVGDSGNGDSLMHPFSHKRALFELLFLPLTKIDQPVKLILIGIKNQNDRQEIESFLKNYENIELEIPKNLNWKNDSWIYSEISRFDIGVSPMVNHPFNEAKSAFKAKQYLSCGVPVIASSVGENVKFVINGFNGILCKTEVDFEKAILSFINMSEEDYVRYSLNCFKNYDEYSLENFYKTLSENVIF